jgi:hypothetical protein
MKTGLILSLGLVLSASAYCDCQVVDGTKKTPFDGKSLSGLAIEKKSLVTLNKAYPALNVVEEAFTGELRTCSNCTEKYVTCSE